ncbi:MAG: hypothetical protein IPK82_30225 [Polyangiaceae bacterium]|nr:hypothetical protein [Polyangiaceae bacterium]
MSTSKPYSIARAELIADQIGRLATQHLHQLAGHHANLAFWLSEAAAAVRTIEDYPHRFKQLRDSQLSWMSEHKTKIVPRCPICRGVCEFGPQTPDRPHRVPAEDLHAARDAVRRSVRQFLVRLYQAGHLTEVEVRNAADMVGASIETEDLRLDQDEIQLSR